MATLSAPDRRPTRLSRSIPTSFCLCPRLKTPVLENSIVVTILHHSVEKKQPLISTKTAKLVCIHKVAIIVWSVKANTKRRSDSLELINLPEIREPSLLSPKSKIEIVPLTNFVAAVRPLQPPPPPPCCCLSLESKNNFVKNGYQIQSSPSKSTTTRNNTALLVIDMQNDFVLEDAPLRVDGGLAIVLNVIKAVEVARQRGFLVVWVVREHDPKGRDVEVFRRHLYGDGKAKPTSKGSKGAELVDGLVIKEEDYKVVKTRFSAFFATNLHSFLQGAGIDSLVVVGVQTPNCIRQSVFDAVELDYKSVTVIVDATAAATRDVHAANVNDMKNIGVAAPTLKEWCESSSSNT
ncbi:unnamed protein product [Lactuca virosa]|uniref:Isochorismatase-like domain-containing protein n=1 Tax=Lactuca virosa TaxID=75947 RepID=A0AAU9MH51_9ASTR|nr:unnamed protein product [Lactuca virosa]